MPPHFYVVLVWKFWSLAFYFSLESIHIIINTYVKYANKNAVYSHNIHKYVVYSTLVYIVLYRFTFCMHADLILLFMMHEQMSNIAQIYTDFRNDSTSISYHILSMYIFTWMLYKRRITHTFTYLSRAYIHTKTYHSQFINGSFLVKFNQLCIYTIECVCVCVCVWASIGLDGFVMCVCIFSSSSSFSLSFHLFFRPQWMLSILCALACIHGDINQMSCFVSFIEKPTKKYTHPLTHLLSHIFFLSFATLRFQTI